MSGLSNNGNGLHGLHVKLKSAIFDVTGNNNLVVQRVTNTLMVFGWVRPTVLYGDLAKTQLVAPDILVIVGGKKLPRSNSPVKYFREMWDTTRIIFVCPADIRLNPRSAIELGIDGIIFETDIEQGLGASAAAVHAGQVVVPQSLGRDLQPPVFSGREKQIIGLVVMGLTNKQISRRLYVSESTVKCHLSSVFQKLGVHSRNEAAAMILDPTRKLGVGILGISDRNSRRLDAGR